MKQRWKTTCWFTWKMAHRQMQHETPGEGTHPSPLPAPRGLPRAAGTARICSSQGSTAVWATRKPGWLLWHQFPHWWLEGREG